MCEAMLSLADRHPTDPRTVDVIAEQILHKFCKRRFGRKRAGGRVAIVTGSAENIGEACEGVPTLWTHRSEERSEGKEWVSTFRTRWSTKHLTKINREVHMQQAVKNKN